MKLKPIQCKVCSAETAHLDTVDMGLCVGTGERFVLGCIGEDADYFICSFCGFVFSNCFDDWSASDMANKIYNQQYIAVDPDYADKRPRQMGAWVANLFADVSRQNRFLDYGSGSCVLAEQLTTAGFSNVAAWDPFSSPERPTGKFDVITCFEVLEHAVNPSAPFVDFSTYLAPGGVAFVSTHLVPETISAIRSHWWYIGPRNGHVSLFSGKAISILAARYNLRSRSGKSEFHVIYAPESEGSEVWLSLKRRADWIGIDYS